MDRPVSVLVVASNFKGELFIEECAREGCQVYLLTALELKDEDWPRDSITDTFYMPEFTKKEDVINAVSYLARTHNIDCIVPMDDFDVELTAALREHLRIPGMGDTTARYFRDKLAMRVQARDEHILCPRFEHVLNYDKLNKFMAEVPGPWFLKPRSEAGSVGIKKINNPQEFWDTVNQLGDHQSHMLVEEYVPGNVYHVDSIVWEDEVLFSNVSRYVKPPFEIWNFGGIFGTRSLPEGYEEEPEITDMNRRVIKAMGLKRGVTHAEFIRSAKDGRIYFLEIASRVGGVRIDKMVEAASGLNMWREWARIEIAAVKKEKYILPERIHECGALLISLAKQAQPDTSAYNDPEVYWRMQKEHHVGLVLKSPSFDRVSELIDNYIPRICRDYMAIEPPDQTVTH